LKDLMWTCLADISKMLGLEDMVTLTVPGGRTLPAMASGKGPHPNEAYLAARCVLNVTDIAPLFNGPNEVNAPPHQTPNPEPGLYLALGDRFRDLGSTDIDQRRPIRTVHEHNYRPSDLMNALRKFEWYLQVLQRHNITPLNQAVQDSFFTRLQVGSCHHAGS
jgi:hypothetical protein